MPTDSVFVAGSRQISCLPAEVKKRIDTMVEKRFRILVGDANGADKAVQTYLAGKAYPNVVVYCMEAHCRNNVGAWPTHQTSAPLGAKGFDYYTVKDRAMADAAEYGLMLWDGKSKGTFNNILSLARQNKLVVVYIALTKSFLNVRSFADLRVVLAKGNPESAERLVHELHLDTLQYDTAG
jgi:hypothetical protein